MRAVLGHNRRGVQQVVRVGRHALGAERLYALVVAVNCLTGVVDDRDAAVRHLHGDNSGVNVRNAGLFLQVRVNEAGADSRDLNSLGTGDIAHHVEVVDHHVVEDAAGNRNVGSRGRLRVTGGNDDDVRIADRAVLNCVSHSLVVVVKAAVEANLELDALLFDQSEQLLDLLDIIVDRLLAEDVLAGVYRCHRDIAVGIRGRADEHDLDLGIVDDIHKVGGNVGDVTLRQPLACAGLVQHRVRNRYDLYAGYAVDQVVDMQLADTAAPDDTDFYICHVNLSLLLSKS